MERVAPALARHRARRRVRDRRGPRHHRAQLRHAHRRGRGGGAEPAGRARSGRTCVDPERRAAAAASRAMVAILAERLVDGAAPRTVGHRLPHRVHRGPVGDPPLPALARGGGLRGRARARPTTWARTRTACARRSSAARSGRCCATTRRTGGASARARGTTRRCPTRCRWPGPLGGRAARERRAAGPRSSTRSARWCRRTSARWPSCGSTSTASRRAGAGWSSATCPGPRASRRCTPSGCWPSARTGCSRATTAPRATRSSSAARPTTPPGPPRSPTRGPARWVAQRWFEALPETRPGGEGQPLNYGVFLVAGEACGLYVRRQAGATDDHAVSVPVLVRPG